jgi:hypothetical protein
LDDEDWEKIAEILDAKESGISKVTNKINNVLGWFK